jgi:hypothetical protein
MAMPASEINFNAGWCRMTAENFEPGEPRAARSRQGQNQFGRPSFLLSMKAQGDFQKHIFELMPPF